MRKNFSYQPAVYLSVSLFVSLSRSLSFPLPLSLALFLFPSFSLSLFHRLFLFLATFVYVQFSYLYCEHSRYLTFSSLLRLTIINHFFPYFWVKLMYFLRILNINVGKKLCYKYHLRNTVSNPCPVGTRRCGL